MDHATLVTIAGAGLLAVWIVAFQTSTYEARHVYVGLSAIAALVALDPRVGGSPCDSSCQPWVSSGVWSQFSRTSSPCTGASDRSLKT